MRCVVPNSLTVIVNEDIDIPITCDDGYLAEKVQPELPKGLKLGKNNIFGKLMVELPSTEYIVKLTNGKEVKITLKSNEISKEQNRELASLKATYTNLIGASQTWYIFQNANNGPESDWNKESFNPAYYPFIWRTYRLATMPEPVGEITTYFRTSFDLTKSFDDIGRFVITISYSHACFIYVNGNLVFTPIDETYAGNYLAMTTTAVSSTNKEIHLPIESFKYGENIIGIEMHTKNDGFMDTRSLSFTLRAENYETDVLPETIFTTVDINGMDIYMEKNPRGIDLANLQRGVDNNFDTKYGTSGNTDSMESLYPNNFTYHFTNGARFVNRMMLASTHANYNFPKTVELYATKRFVGNRGDDSDWIQIVHYSKEENDYAQYTSYTYAPEGSFTTYAAFEAYRIRIVEPFYYYENYGHYMEFMEMRAMYARPDMCFREDLLPTYEGGVSYGSCPDGQGGYTEYSCSESSFSDPVQVCEDAEVTELFYTNNNNTLTFKLGVEKMYVPEHDGIVSDYSMNCPTASSYGFVINSVGIIYGKPTISFNETCEVSYTPYNEEPVQIEVTFEIENTYCDGPAPFPTTVAGQSVTMNCEEISQDYESTGVYTCVADEVPYWEATERCKYKRPTVMFEETSITIVRESQISIYPILVNNYTQLTLSGMSGLSVDQTTGHITGTAPSNLGTYNLFLTAANPDGQNQASCRVVVVNAYTSSLQYPSTITFVTGMYVESEPPQIDAESSIGSCTVNPALPAGLSINCNTGVIFGAAEDVDSDSTTTHTVTITEVSVSSNQFSIEVLKRSCQGDSEFETAYPGGISNKPCTEITATPYGNITKECIFNSETKEASWGNEVDSGCHVAYPTTFSVPSNTFTAVTDSARSFFLNPTPYMYSLYSVTLDPPATGVFVSYASILFYRGSSYIANCTISLTGDETLTQEVEFKVYPPTCTEDGFGTVGGGEVATKPCDLPEYGTISATCSTSQVPYAYVKVRNCHEAYPTSVVYTFPQLYVSFPISTVTPTIENRLDTMTFEWKDDIYPAGLRLDSRTGVISGTPTESTEESPNFIIIVHGDVDKEVEVNINVILLKCEATEIFPETEAGKTGMASCQEGYEGYQSAECTVRTVSGSYVASFGSISNQCTAAPPSFTYTEPTEAFIVNQDRVSLRPTYNENVYRSLVWSSSNLPAGLSIDSNTGEISGIPTAVPENSRVTIFITAQQDELTSSPYGLTLYISTDRLCKAVDGRPISTVGVVMDSPCTGGKVGNQRYECLSGGEWSELIVANCTNPNIKSGDNGTVQWDFTINDFSIDDITLNDIDGFRQGFARMLEIEISRVQVAIIKFTEETSRLLQEIDSVNIGVYVDTDNLVTAAYVSEILPRFRTNTQFRTTFVSVAGSNSKISSSLSTLDITVGQTIFPEVVKEDDGLSTTWIIVISVVGGVAVLLLLILICCCVCYCKANKQASHEKQPAKKHNKV